MASRTFTEAQRREFADQGIALPDGSYPMPDCDAVERALEDYPRAPDTHRAELAALIRGRNEQLECYHDTSRLDGEAASDGSGAEDTD